MVHFLAENFVLGQGLVDGKDHFIETAKTPVIEIEDQPRQTQMLFVHKFIFQRFACFNFAFCQNVFEVGVQLVDELFRDFPDET